MSSCSTKKATVTLPVHAIVFLLLACIGNAPRNVNGQSGTAAEECADGSVRLQGGDTNAEGNVEVCVEGVWNQVCDSNWDSLDATVVCRQLNHSVFDSQAYGLSLFGAGTVPSGYSDFQCTSVENTLLDCPRGNSSTCGANHLAGVRCRLRGRCEADGHLTCCSSNCNTGDCWCDATCFLFNDCCFEDIYRICSTVSNPSSECTEGDVRLVGGNRSEEGRVELCVDGNWSTVCDQGWDAFDAAVTCKQLSLPYTGAQALGGAYFGQGNELLRVSNVQCTGIEPSLSSCTYDSAETCGHQQDAGVLCVEDLTSCNHSSVRLIGGDTLNDGLVQVCLEGKWEFVCDEDWSADEASVVCNQSGFPAEGAESIDLNYLSTTTNDATTVPLRFNCAGNESALLECPYSQQPNCSASTLPVGVVCKIPCNNGDLRVIGGGSLYEGRLETCQEQTWGSVCQESWGSFDAAVACRQLGFSAIDAIAFGEAFFGEGVGPIHLTQVQCTGEETNLTQCLSSNVTDSCQHSMDVGITCSGPLGSCESAGITSCCNSISNNCNANGCFCDIPCLLFNDCCDDIEKLCTPFLTNECTNGQLRLVEGSTDTEGRLELCFEGQWTSVCDDSFGIEDAKVACSQLGYPLSVHRILDGAEFGQGNGYIAVGSFQCVGNESSLLNCIYETSPDCSHHQDVELSCDVQNCSNGDIFLFEGDTPFDGTVEVCINGVLGTVCDDEWDNNDASVACRQLGYSSIGASAYGLRPASLLPIVTTIRCNGSETDLGQCEHSLQPACKSHEVAGVVCIGLMGECEAAGITTCCNGDQCSTGTCRCDTACRDDQSCCSDIDNICPLAVCSIGDIRLASGTTFNSGRVEICNDGRWSTVCDRGWSEEDAAVTCRNLGFPSYGSVPTTIDFFPLGSGQPVGGDFQCVGTEVQLNTCSFSDSLNCGHHEDAGVICPIPCTEGEVRLANTVTSLYSGRVEVCLYGDWVSVCLDGWSNEEAQVICEAIGSIKQDAQALPRAEFGLSPTFVPVFSISCTGAESDLLNCSISNSSCSLGGGAAVECYERCFIEGEVRLVGGKSEMEGQVEICQNGFWGGVCDTIWCESNAKVVCGQLGYSTFRFEAYIGSYFNSTPSAIFADDVKCTGQESSLLDCSHKSDNIDCDSRSLASVVCYPKTPCEIHQGGSPGCCVSGCNTGPCWCDIPCHILGDCCEGIQYSCPLDGFCLEGDTRLVNGTNGASGLVEVCVNGKFGTVCNSSWSDEDATVVCANLGLPFTGAKAVIGSSFTSEYVPAVAGSFECIGTEPNLLSCQYTEGECCDDDEKAGVICASLESSFTTTVSSQTFTITTTNDILPTSVNFSPVFTSTVQTITPLPSISPVPTCVDGDVRLVNGSNSNEGIVETCSTGVWFQICDDEWTSNDAEVVCHQLGYTRFFAQAYGGSFFGETSNPFGYFGFECESDEDSLQLCTHSVTTSCAANSQGAGVRCLPRFTGTCEAAGFASCCEIFCNTGSCWCDIGCYDFGDCCADIDLTCPNGETIPECVSGDIRLIGGETFMEGRVELCVDGKWSTICDQGWDTPDAAVVCRQLDLSVSNPTALPGASFGQGSVPVLVTNFQCMGDEQSLYAGCSYSTTVDCSHLNDAAVSCPAPSGPCNNGSVRVTGGSSAYEGQIQVCLDQGWVSVCDNGWSDQEASVVCQQLGFSGIGALSINANEVFMNISANVITAEINFNCTGNELSLLDCPYTELGNICQASKKAAGVVCPEPCFSGNMRLVGGDNDLEGRVELCVDGFWGSVCDDSWSSYDATVACRQLGFSSIEPVPYGQSHFGQSLHLAVLTEVQCDGSEASLLECQYGSNTDTCNSTTGAGIRCKGIRGVCEEAGHLGCCELGCLVSGCFCDVTCHNLNDCCPDINNTCPAPSVECVTGDIRLVGGANEAQGRVELCLEGRWSSVCGKQWGNAESFVVCSHLGLVPSDSAEFNFGVGDGYIAVSMECDGDESSPFDCTITENPDCSHDYDVIVTCVIANCTYGSVRLIEGSVPFEGTLEICNGSHWSSVCDYEWDSTDATVVCRQLGYSTIDASAYGDSFHSVGFASPLLRSFHCIGNESLLTSCMATSSQYCESHEVAGVRCLGPIGECEMAGLSSCCVGNGCSVASCSCDPKCRNDSTCCSDINNTCPEDECTTGSVQLVGGNSPYNGRVELCYDSQWRTICDEGWSDEEARVACRQLGLPSYGAFAVSSGLYPQGSGQPVGGDFRCNGTETQLSTCIYSTSLACGHHEDAGVICPSPCEEGDVRLVDFTYSFYSGRVEVCYERDWVSLCLDGWSNEEAQVICQQIGSFKEGADALSGSPFGLAPDFVSAVAYECTGSESSLSECSVVNTQSCSLDDGASVACVEPCTNEGLRLVGGSSSTEGQVELCLDGAWSAVCDTAWCESNARVVCQQLGFSIYRYEANAGSNYGYPSQVIALDNVQCSGQEANLTQCVHSTDTQCTPSNLAGVVCYEKSQCEVLQEGSAGCCQPPGCTVITTFSDFCFCDLNCYIFDDCCQDIEYTCSPSGDCVDGTVRLVEGETILEGYVEVCKDKLWSAVCAESWGPEEAAVVCQQLGVVLPAGASPGVSATANNLSQSIPVIGGEYLCSGSEDMIFECDHSLTYCCESNTVAQVNCNQSQVVSTTTELSHGITSSLVVGSMVNVISSTVVVVLSSSSFSSSSNTLASTFATHMVTTAVVGSPVRPSATSGTVESAYTSSPVASERSVPTISLSSSRAVLEPTSQPVPEPTSQPVPERTSQPVPEPTSQPVPESTSEPVIESTSEPVPESTSEPVSESTSVPLIPTLKPYPDVVLENTVTVVLGGFTTITFTVEVKTSFITVVMEVTFRFCSSNPESCVSISFVENQNTKRQIGYAVVITDTVDNSDGILEVTFFVLASDGNVLSRDALLQAIQAGIADGSFADAGFADVSVKEELESASGLSGIAMVAIVFAVIVVFAVIIVAIVVIVIIILKRKSTKYDMFSNENPLTNSNQLCLQEVQAVSENGNGSLAFREKSDEKMLEDLNYSDTKPIVPTDDED